MENVREKKLNCVSNSGEYIVKIKQGLLNTIRVAKVILLTVVVKLKLEVCGFFSQYCPKNQGNRTNDTYN